VVFENPQARAGGETVSLSLIKGKSLSLGSRRRRNLDLDIGLVVDSLWCSTGKCRQKHSAVTVLFPGILQQHRWWFEHL
jgi:hypothetical protein